MSVTLEQHEILYPLSTSNGRRSSLPQSCLLTYFPADLAAAYSLANDGGAFHKYLHILALASVMGAKTGINYPGLEQVNKFLNLVQVLTTM